MKAIDLLSTSLGRRDDKANLDLAVEIIRSKRNDWVKELVENLNHKDNNIQSDCIKVLYEIGKRDSAEMIAPFVDSFGELLKSKNNRLIWGAMTALDTIALINPEGVYGLLRKMFYEVEGITIDHCVGILGVGILAKLACIENYTKEASSLLIKQLERCPSKKLPMYAEKSIIAINAANQDQFIDLIKSRIPEMDKLNRKLISTLNSLLNRSNPVVTKYLNMLAEKLEKMGSNCFCIYRGQENHMWDLQSGAQRRLDNAFKQEHRELRELSNCDYIIYHKHLLEKARFAGIGRINNDNNDKTKKSDLDLLAEIQHYGGATCLTDFSKNFLVALWCATEEPDNGKNVNGKIFIVNLLDQKNFNIIYPIKENRKNDSIDNLLKKRIEFAGDKNDMIPRMWTWQPNKLNNRINRQDSVFLFGLTRFNTKSFNFEEITVSSQDKKKIREELRMFFNISTETIYDDLPGFSFNGNNSKASLFPLIFENRPDFQTAKALFKNGEYESAIKYLEKCLSMSNDSGETSCNRCEKRNECELVIAETKNPKIKIQAMILYEKGKSYFKSEKYDEALRDFEEVLKLEKNHGKWVQYPLELRRFYLNILHKLRAYENAYSFCIDMFKNRQMLFEYKGINGKDKECIEYIKEFYFIALELSVIHKDRKRFDDIDMCFTDSQKNVLHENACGLLYKYYKTILRITTDSCDEKNEIEEFNKSLEGMDGVSILDSNNYFYWDFDDIEKWINERQKELNNTANMVIITQKIKEIQDQVNQKEMERVTGIKKIPSNMI